MNKRIFTILAALLFFCQIHAQYYIVNGVNWQYVELKTGVNYVELSGIDDYYWIEDENGNWWDSGIFVWYDDDFDNVEGTFGLYGSCFGNVTEDGIYEIVLKETSTGSVKISFHRVYLVDHKDSNGDVVCTAYSRTNDDSHTISLSATADANGLYSYVCDNGCGTVLNSTKVIKDFTEGNNIELNVDEDGNYSTTEDVAFTDASSINIPVSFTTPTLNYTRTFSNTTYNALYVPFSIPVSELDGKADIYRLLNIFENDNDDNGTIDEWVLKVVKLKDGESTKANTPYIIKPKATGDMTLSLSDVTLAKAEENSVWCASTDYKFTFTGSYAAKTIAADSYFFISGDGYIQYAASDAALKSQRWYMGIHDKETDDLVAPSTFNPGVSAGAKAVRIVCDEDVATGIEEMQTVRSAMQNCYNLNGQRINAPQKGINIINGKKVLVK